VILSWLATLSFLYALAGLRVGDTQSVTLRELSEGTPPPPGQLQSVTEQLTIASQALSKIHAYLTATDDPMVLAPGEAVQRLARASQRLSGRDAQSLTSPSGTDDVPERDDAGPLRISDRGDANRVLDLLIGYFKANEPGHPAPIFLERVQRMLGASFEELMRELYQEAPALLSRLQKPGQQ